MLQQIFLLSFTMLYGVVPTPLITGSTVVPNDKEYYKYDIENVEIIHTKDNIPFAKETAAIEGRLHKEYEQSFKWKLDETLYVGLISDYNQIANGFSTQWPNNREINYVGGAQMVDYFCSTSWLQTLLIHETAHNYQLNLKDNRVSQWLHRYFGNGMVLLPLPLTVPNSLENSFMLEGNAVLNESLYQNGGRLYSGRFKVETLLQAKAGNINAAEVYNSKLAFPYGGIHYIQGGFYNLYLAQKYGLESVNSYFRYHSQDWFWPMRTNASMQDAIGVNFETSLNAFAKEYAELAKNVTMAEGESIASSQFFSPLGEDKEEIFFVTNESGYSRPELVVVDKQERTITKERDGWMMSGRVIKQEGEYFVQGSRHTSATKIEQGLFDSGAFIKEGSSSKIVQAYLSDGESVYFDVASSYSEPQLYIGDTLYTRVNSSVIVDSEDNLYYFKQDKERRTLYKNLMPLYTYEGYYGIVSDVDSKGAIYFVANSEFGSTLYRYNKGEVERASSADNIVEARLLNDKELLIAAISESEYYYVTTALESIEGTPYVTRLGIDAKEYDAGEEAKERYSDIEALESPYNSLFEMHYSGTNASILLGSINPVASVELHFGDALSQNAALIFANRSESNITIAGVGYRNSAYILEYSAQLYGVVEKGSEEASRDYGLILQASLPLYQAGYYYGALGATYYQDYDTLEREPLTLSLDILREEQYGKSLYANSLYALKLYGVQEREERLSGGEISYGHELSNEFYFGAGFKYTQSDAKSSMGAKGVKLSSSLYQADRDPSTLVVPNIKQISYLKSASYLEASLAKVLNFSAYYFTSPLSLQRESLYLKYRHYNMQDFKESSRDTNEMTLGGTLYSIFLNNYILPLTLEYSYCDAQEDGLQNEHLLRFSLGAYF